MADAVDSMVSTIPVFVTAWGMTEIVKRMFPQGDIEVPKPKRKLRRPKVAGLGDFSNIGFK